jgi:hypothetical protein
MRLLHTTFTHSKTFLSRKTSYDAGCTVSTSRTATRIITSDPRELYNIQIYAAPSAVILVYSRITFDREHGVTIQERGLFLLIAVILFNLA